jgi:putative acetyltransferase
MVIIKATGGDDVDLVRGLLRQYAASLPFDLAYQDFDGELARLPAPYVAPLGTLLLAKFGAIPAAVAGLKPLAAGVAEIKRLYVVPEARGRGIGQKLLCQLLDDAYQMGYWRVRLDSHRPSMGAAISIYRRLGFTEIPPYGPDLEGEIACFEKKIEIRAPAGAIAMT